jgi:hypothetical protein
MIEGALVMIISFYPNKDKCNARSLQITPKPHANALSASVEV